MKETDPDPQKVDDEILLIGSADYLDMWFITRTIGRLVPGADEEQVKGIVLDSLKRLLASDRIQAGELYPPGEFSPWPFDTDETIERIRVEWEKLDRFLQPGDVAWFYVLQPQP